MIFLGIDYGLERTGLACSDPDGKIAFPAGCLALARFGGRKALLDKIAEIARQKMASALVMGLPLLANGQETLTTRQARNAAARIVRRAQLPLYLMPELLSSDEAARDLRECGLTWRQAARHLDEQAACRILQSFLDLPEKERRLA